MTQRTYRAITPQRAREVVDAYERYAIAALKIVEKLSEEIREAETQNRPINQGRFLAVCRWFGVTRPIHQEIMKS